jgi:hypothetical protein
MSAAANAPVANLEPRRLTRGVGSRSLFDARTTKIRNVYKKHFDSANFSTNVNNPTLYPLPPSRTMFRGPICDPIGFSQHGGECWSDTIQQLVLFSDGLKDHTQPYYYNTPFEEIGRRIDLFVEEDLQAIVKNYVRAMKTRFINHYNLIVTGDPIFEACVIAPDYRNTLKASTAEHHKLYRQQSLVLALNSARSVVGWEKETSGTEFHQFEKLYNILVQLTDADFSIALKETRELYGSDIVFGCYAKSVTHYIQISVLEPELGHVLTTYLGGGHAVGFLKCDNKYFFYDDNTGLFEIKLPFNEMSKVCGIHIYRDIDSDTMTLRVIGGEFGLKELYNTGEEKVNNLILMKGTIWNGTGWEKIPDDYFEYKENSVMMALSNKERYALTKIRKRLYPIMPSSSSLKKPLGGVSTAAGVNGGTRRHKRRERKTLRKRRLRL